MKSGYILITLCVILIIIPTIALSIASLIIGSQNTNTTCDTSGGDVMRLSTWLFVNACFSMGIIIFYILLLVIFVKKEQYKFLIAFIVIYIMNWLFVISWNIIGAVQLFEHSENCKSQAGSLWIMTLISLIFQWIGIFQICCIRRYDKSMETMF